MICRSSRFSFLCIILGLHVQAAALTTSLIIPCYYKHAQYLYSLLKQYEQQTVIPDEVVITLSECDKVDPVIIDAIKHESWIFPVTLIAVPEKNFAGPNRNRACNQAVGDIFILQDADDIPHPQRIEIIKYFFESYPIVHLMHGYSFATNYEEVTQQCAQFMLYEHMQDIFFIFSKKQKQGKYVQVTNGNVALRREVFAKVQWPDIPRGQDTQFNRMVFQNFDNRVVMKEPLIIYRNFLSSLQQ